jgi:hypothetical protein
MTLMLAGIGFWSCQFDGLAAPPSVARNEAPWVRTADGWERAGSWLATSSATPPKLHPLVVAAGQLLVSLLALAIWENDANGRTPPSAAATRART